MMTVTPARPIRVLIVDDSPVIRSIIEKILAEDKDIQVCGFASNGEQAVRSVKVCDPDIIILDIEMPVMDGITALPLLLKAKPGVRVLMCSTLSQRGADISVTALSLGATDCILKPTGVTAITQTRGFHEELLYMVKHIGSGALRHRATALSGGASAPVTRSRSVVQPEIVAIGSSTGGPNALGTVLRDLQDFPLPIVITQHMPKTFTRVLADHLSLSTGARCVEAEGGMLLTPGRVYIAPGGLHLTFRRTTQGIETHLNDGPMENFCKPSVDVMLRSLHSLYGNKILVAMLTGMGEDGLRGARPIAEAGGQVIAQNAETSIVWGMPGAVANAGLCNEVLPLPEIGGYIRRKCAVHARKTFETAGSI